MTAPIETVSPVLDRISFRLELPADEAFLSKLYATTRDVEMALTGWDSTQQEAFLRMQFQFQTTHYRKHYSDASFQIILRDNTPIGRIYIHYGAREIRLMDIALLPESRRSGVGGAILENLLRDEIFNIERRIAGEREIY